MPDNIVSGPDQSLAATDKPVTDFSASAGAARRFRSPLVISGFVLWILVFASAGFLIWQRAHPREQSANTGSPTRESIVADLRAVSSDGQSGAVAASQQNGGPQATVTAGTRPTPKWDSAGVDDFAFTERSGKKVTKADLLGHPWLVCFVFTRCAGPCPRVSLQMSELQKQLQGYDVRLVTLTVDPDFDKTDVLQRYAQAYNADPKRWLYLTGDKRKTYELINKSFQMPVLEYTGKDREPGYQVLHSTNILLVNEKGVVVQKYNALDEADMARLRKDLKPYLAKNRVGHEAPQQKTSAAGGKGETH